jgi:malate dehydrogenase (quinone)
MIPSLGAELSNEPKLFEEVWAWGSKVLKLDRPATSVPVHSV